MAKHNLSVRGARGLVALALVILLAAQLWTAPTAFAIPSGAPNPGTSFDKASGLGLTYPGAKSNNGIKLSASSGTYYFTFTLTASSSVSFWFSSTQRPKTSLPSGTGVITLYNSGRSKQSGAGRVTCPSGLFCYGGATFSNLPSGSYYLAVNMGQYQSASGTSTGYLTWKADKFSGSQSSTALPWYSRTSLYAYMPSGTTQQWYKVNMTSGQKGSLKLYGDSGSNLNIQLYSDSSTTVAFASGTLTRYPESFSFTVPAKASFIYAKVENAGKTASEYYIQLTR